MAETTDHLEESGGDYLDRCEDRCEDCEDETSQELYFCQACALTLCSDCWDAQTAHKPRRRSSARPGNATLHEKTKFSIIKLVQPAFSTAADQSTLKTRLAEDMETAWFGE